jgi:hypothetical protein
MSLHAVSLLVAHCLSQLLPCICWHVCVTVSTLRSQNGVSSVSDPKFQTHWSEMFLRYERLCVPWRLILGNHDYQTNPQAQIDFTNDQRRNRGGLWQMPAPTYSFSCLISDPDAAAAAAASAAALSPAAAASSKASAAAAAPEKDATMSIDFFAFDTNGVQGDVQRRFPEAQVCARTFKLVCLNFLILSLSAHYVRSFLVSSTVRLCSDG